MDRVTPGLPPGAFGEERARIKCEPDDVPGNGKHPVPDRPINFSRGSPLTRPPPRYATLP